MRLASRGGGWPDAEQLLLLHVTLDDPAAAGVAWRSWVARRRSVEQLPHTTRRLLPQAGRRLDALGAAGPVVNRVRAMVADTWVLNRRLLRAAAPALRALREGGIEAIIFKGAAVAATIQGGLATRPMWDIDVLVRSEDVDVAGRTLGTAGFQDTSPLGLRATRGFTPGAAFRDAGGAEIDLHWRPVPQPVDAGDVLDNTRATQLGEEPVLVPSAEDMLVHACAHGLSAGSSGPRWIADAALVIRDAGEALDWDRVVRRSRAYGLGLVMGTATAFLRREFGVPVPNVASDALAALPSTRAQRLAHELVMRPAWIGQMVHHVEQWDFHRRGGKTGMWAFFGYEADRVGLDGRPALVRHWGRRARELARRQP